MFYTPKEKVRLEAKFFELQDQIFNLRNRIEILEVNNKALLKTAINKAKAESEAPWGLKNDGTPRAKPGRKAK